MWVETQPSAQSSIQNLTLIIGIKKQAKLDITFLKSCPILLCFFSLCQIFWLGL